MKFDLHGAIVQNTAIKMATFTGMGHACCVFWFHETKSATTVQCTFHTEYGEDPPSRPTIYFWHRTFFESGRSDQHAKSTGRPKFLMPLYNNLKRALPVALRINMTWFL